MVMLAAGVAAVSPIPAPLVLVAAAVGAHLLRRPRLAVAWAGVVAVWMGGWKRLAGPLFLGTGLVVTVTVLESLTTLAGVPTWAWLAAGGATLLSAGVALERSATTPVEAGRRLVDVVDERFS